MKTSIKWRAKTPMYRAVVSVSTIVGLIAATGAPMKWGCMMRVVENL